MKVPVSWLVEYCDPGIDPADLARRLAMTGTEVERVTGRMSGDPGRFVIGKTVEVGPHPDADRLSVCEVDDGTGTRTIVCGAPNVAAGQTVVVALPGAVMPGGMEIGEAKLRGVLSSGMICSEEELGLGDEDDGILVLEDGPEPGTPAAEILPLDEPVLELEVTPNRPDSLSIYGVAREVHAITGAELVDPPWDGWTDPDPEEVSDLASVRIDDPGLCPRFTLRVFTGVEVGESPAWLRNRLVSAGQRPINNVVDVTNYVMLLTGQPLHAFDLDRVPGGELVVRAATEGEKVETLDGVERELPEGTVVVCDRDGPTAIAGIMGGASSEVSSETTSVLLEVATWDGPGILKSSRELGLRSEASNRFEKGLHPALASRAQAIASKLLVEVCGGEAVPGMVDEGTGIPEEGPVRLGAGTAARVLGMEIPAATQEESLERLGFGVEAGDGGFSVLVPPDRAFDVTREIDLVEEVARVADLDAELPATLPATSGGGLSREQALRRTAEDSMVAAGFDETVSWSFTSADSITTLGLDPTGDPRARPVAISNPLSEEQAVMRTTLLTSLVDAASRNLARGTGGVRLFESGRVYLPAVESDEVGGRFPGDRPAPALEPLVLGALASGDLVPGDWRGDGVPADFFSLKGVLEQVAGASGVSIEVIAGTEPFLHPGKAGRVLVDGHDLGWIGELHPSVASAFGLGPSVAFEVGLERLVAASPAGQEDFVEVPSFPPIERDLAIVIPDTVAASEIESALRTGGGDLLEQVVLFDRYMGEQVGDGMCSLAFSLRFRAPDRTLSDEEVDPLWDKIVESVESIGGTIRG
ncbi:MAG: phenylalanine--tRNA ligase subunit beta [Solirubrobacterales bacterium]